MVTDFEEKIIPFALHPLGFLDAFVRMGAPLTDLLLGTEISEPDIYSKSFKISYLQQTVLLENGLRYFSRPGLGLEVGANFCWDYHGSVGAIRDCSPSLADAGAAFRRYMQIAQPLYRNLFAKPDYYLDKGQFLVTPIKTLIEEHDAPELSRFELEFRLALTLRLYDCCGNKEVSDPSVIVGLHYDQPEYMDVFGSLPITRIQFNCQHPFIAACHDFFTKPWRPLRQPVYKRVIRQCEEEFRQAGVENTLAERVYWLLSKNFNRGVQLQDVADELELTPRALTRKLSQESTSFRAIQNQVKMELTQLHLDSSALSIDELAKLMGFSGASNLRRAIRSWVGEGGSDNGS